MIQEREHLEIDLDRNTVYWNEALVPASEYEHLYNVQSIFEPIGKNPGAQTAELWLRLFAPNSPLDTVIVMGENGSGKTSWLTQQLALFQELRKLFPEKFDHIEDFEYFSLSEEIQFAMDFLPYLFLEGDEPDFRLRDRKNWGEREWQVLSKMMYQSLRFGVLENHLPRRLAERKARKRLKFVDTIGIRGMTFDEEIGDISLSGANRGVTAIAEFAAFVQRNRFINNVLFVFFIPDIRTKQKSSLRRDIANAEEKDIPGVFNLHKTIMPRSLTPAEIKQIALLMGSQETIERVSQEVELAADQIWKSNGAWRLVKMRREDWKYPYVPYGVNETDWKVTQKKAFYYYYLSKILYGIPETNVQFLISPYMETLVHWQIEILKELTSMGR